jgi:hypothetical protein
MLINYRGEFNPEITYLYGDVFKAKTEAGHGVFVVVSTDMQNITDTTHLISLVGRGIICLSGEFSATDSKSDYILTYTDIVYCGIVTRSLNIYLTSTAVPDLFIDTYIPETLIAVPSNIKMSNTTSGYEDGMLTGLIDNKTRFRAITTNKIPYAGSYKSFDLCFTFSQQISGGE